MQSSSGCSGVSTRGASVNDPSHVSDPEVRFAIPNERQFKRYRRYGGHKVTLPRIIALSTEGTSVKVPSSLPFEGSGMQWRGRAAITAAGLKKQVDSTFRRATRSTGTCKQSGLEV